MGNQQSNTTPDEQQYAAPPTSAVDTQSTPPIERAFIRKFKLGDTVFTVGEFEDLPEGTPVTVTDFRQREYIVRDRRARHIQLPEAALSYTAKIRPVERDEPIDVPWAQRERRVPEAKDEEDEEDEEDEDECRGCDDSDEEDRYEPAPQLPQLPRLHPCGKCTVEWQCACNNGDVELNHNFEDDLAAAMRASALEAEEDAAAMAAAIAESTEKADPRGVADLDDYDDEDTY
jgi:hypothetical protein